jgi:dephospho-CoA kinase
MDTFDALNRLSAQASDDERKSIATTVIDNSGSLGQLYEQLDNWYEQQISRLF